MLEYSNPSSILYIKRQTPVFSRFARHFPFVACDPPQAFGRLDPVSRKRRKQTLKETSR
jgi:hypothetical protein